MDIILVYCYGNITTDIDIHITGIIGLALAKSFCLCPAFYIAAVTLNITICKLDKNCICTILILDISVLKLFLIAVVITFCLPVIAQLIRNSHRWIIDIIVILNSIAIGIYRIILSDSKVQLNLKLELLAVPVHRFALT